MMVSEAIPVTRRNPIATYEPFQPMSPREFVDLCNHFSLGIQEAAAFFGLNPRTMIRYQNGPDFTNGAEVPKPIAMLLRAMVHMNMAPEDIHKLGRFQPDHD